MEILVVEDDPLVGSLTVEFLSAEGHDVQWSCCVDDAFQAICAQHYGVILLDLVLGESTGEHLVARLRRQGASVPPIVLISGEPQALLGEVAHRIGALKALRKPCSLGAIREALDALS